jgi:cobalt-zinc-cadmium efflux system outer membrane protein
MSSQLVISLLAPAIAAAGCAGPPGLREHDAMVAALQRLEPDRPAPAAGDLGPPPLGSPLDRAALVAAVLAQNPDAEAARQTWRGAIAGYPAAVALADPMLTYEVAPFSVTGDAPYGQRIQISQKLPFPGKRELAGAAALADAQAAEADFTSLRLDLAEATIDAFDDDYVTARALEVNQHHRALLERIEKSAIAQYTVGRGSPQDPLEARAEIIALDRERLMLEARQRAAIAKINRLLRRRADAELPPPPVRLEVVPPSSPTAEPHPRQQAAAARIRARRANVEQAGRAFYPDVELMASYDSMWDIWQHRWMIGVGLEIPLQRGRRRASAEVARAEEAKATAELASVTDMLAEDRDRTRREVDEATRALGLYEDQLLPTERARVEAAIAGFTAGQNPLSTVVMAEHSLRNVELQIEQTRADLDRRIAAFDRAQGRVPGGAR